MRLLSSQCRAARGLLNWRQEDLANRAAVSRSTIRDFEGEIHSLQRTTEERLLAAFDVPRIELIGHASAAAGVPGNPHPYGIRPEAYRSAARQPC